MTLIEKFIETFRRHGWRGTASKVSTKVMHQSGYTKWKFRNAPVYANPTPQELALIERSMVALGIEIHDYAPLSQNSMSLSPKGGFHRSTMVN